MVTAAYSLMRSYISSIVRPSKSGNRDRPRGRSRLCFLLFFQLEIQPEPLDLVRRHLERDGRAGLQDVLPPDHRLVDLGPAVDVVRLDGQELLENVRRAVGLERPHFHFAEALAARAGLAAQRLLRDERV